jgi:hypothetical protein
MRARLARDTNQQETELEDPTRDKETENVLPTRGFHPMNPVSFMRFLSSVDRRRKRANHEFVKLGRNSSLLWVGEDSGGRRLAMWHVENREEDMAFSRRRSWRRLLEVDPGPAGGVLFLLSSTLAGPRHTHVGQMREALTAKGWEVRFGTDATPEDIVWVTRDPLIRPLFRDIKRRWKVEIHPASESPRSEMARLHPHGWIDGETFRIGLTFDPEPHVLGHELMHLLLYEQGYPDAVPFTKAALIMRDEVLTLLCGFLDVEVDRRLAELGFDLETDAIEHAQHAVKDELPPNLVELDHALLAFARLRNLPEGAARRRFVRWARRSHREAFAVATDLDRMLPKTLSPEDVTEGILAVADRFGIDPGFMPAPVTVHGRADIPVWCAQVRARAGELNAPAEAIDRLTAEWMVRPISKDNWPVQLPAGAHAS